MAAINGANNPFPAGECTYYASDRYHQLTSYYVPWSGDAWQWSGNAAQYGWTISSTPIIPSIICLQPGVQGADSKLGHVGVAEKLNSNGSVATTDLNWGTTAGARATVSNVDFQPGSGVSFISATGGNSNLVDITLKDFCTSVITQLRNNAGQTNALGAGPSNNIVNFLVSWAHHEGGSQTNACQFNVLNTMQSEPGSTQCSGTLPGIQSYPDAATGEKAQIDALQNGLYPSLLHALTTNDEGNLGFTAPFTMANDIAGDLSMWVSGKRSPIQTSYILAIMSGAGISNANVSGGNANGGAGAGQATIDSWGSTVIGQGTVNQPQNPLDALTQGLSGLNTFFTNVNSLFSNPTRIIKIVGGSVLVITGLVLLVKQFVPAGALKAAALA
jgi:surface antigen